MTEKGKRRYSFSRLNKKNFYCSPISRIYNLAAVSCKLTPKVTVFKQRVKKINEIGTNCVSYNCNCGQKALFTVMYYVQNINEYLQHIIFWFFFYVLLTVHISILISVFNQLYAQNFVLQYVLFHVFTCFEHMCSKHVETYCKTKFCALSWLNTEISIFLLFKSVFANVDECNNITL